MTRRCISCSAQALEAEGKHHEAAGELQISLKLKDTAEAHLSLAHVYLSMNQPELARVQGQAALDLDPGNPQAEQFMQQNPCRSPGGKEDALSAKILRPALVLDRSSCHRITLQPPPCQPSPGRGWWRLSST